MNWLLLRWNAMDELVSIKCGVQRRNWLLIILSAINWSLVMWSEMKKLVTDYLACNKLVTGYVE